MTEELVLAERDGAVGIARLNRPDARNALSPEVMNTLCEICEAWDTDPEVRCIVVAGGEDYFAAGADIKGLRDRTFQDSLVSPTSAFWQRMAAIKTPLVAAVSGFALGGGCELALACDLRFASSKAKLGQPEINLGIIPGWGGTQRLARTTSLGFAKELILTGRTVGAEEALERGLVNAVTEPGELLPRVMETAVQLAAKSPLALEAAKQAINRALSGEHADNLAREADRFGELFASEDANEGLTAFVEKRDPKFAGR
jgi:enoyl-CoA hydratase